MKAYKGFDKDLKCRDFQYEVGKEYETDSAIPCETGFHACENPLAVWDYYPPCDGNRFCEVEQSGEIKTEGNKSVSTKIKVNAEIGIAGLVKMYIDLLREKTINKIGSLLKLKKSNDNGEDSAKIGSSGDSAKIGSSGDSAQIGSSGDYAKIGSSGDSARIDCKGRNAVVACAGANNAVRGVVGTWACLSEYAVVDGEYRCVGMKAFQIDGITYKADVWYVMRNGEIVEDTTD